MRWRVAMAAVLAVLAVAGPAKAATLQQVGSFASPVFVTSDPNDATRLFVVERRGTIQLVAGGTTRPFLDIVGLTLSGGEQGLLSMAFAPDFASSGRFYVYYTSRPSGDIQIDEFVATGDSVDPASRRPVITIPHNQAGNHNGGQLQFGPDGLLYVATGDGGGGGDPAENAQDKTSLLGKLLRIDPRKNGRRPYRVPGSNPYAGKRKRGDGEIYARGLRNPYRFSWNGGRIAIGDVGQDRFEEVDYETRRSLRGANFGWDNYEGFSPYEGGGLRGHDRPIHVYSHSSGCAITGGYVVRDPDLPSLRGRYVYGDLCTGQIRSLKPRLRRARGDSATGLPGRGGLVSFGEDARRNVYVVAGGRVSRIVRR
jgi:glucose/arabinose dehydrogenase